MNFEQNENTQFKSAITKAVVKLLSEDKALSINNIALASRYPRREIELNLYEVGLICEQIEER